MSDIPTKVSVAAEAVYPHLVKPDVRFNELGEYKVTLKVAKQDASQMVKEIDQAIERQAQAAGRTKSATQAILEKDGGMSRLREGLKREKAIEFILKSAKIVTA